MVERTLFVGGASPIGYHLAFNLKKRIKTDLTVVDIPVKGKKIMKLHSTKYNMGDQFNKKNSDYHYDRVICNLYELLDSSTLQHSQENENIILAIINKLIEIIKSNPKCDTTIILNSYHYQFPQDNYQESFNLYNNLIIEFVNLISKTNKSIIKFIFLPNILAKDSNGLVNRIIYAIENGQNMVITDSFRDYLLLRDIDTKILDILLLKESSAFEFTSGFSTSNSYVYNQLTERLSQKIIVQNVKSSYDLIHYREWFNTNKKVNNILVNKAFDKIIFEYLEQT